MNEKVVILVPVLNDEEALNILLVELGEKMQDSADLSFTVFIVDDGSAGKIAVRSTRFPVQVLHLHRNIGHQKAIAIGLAYINKNLQFDKVLVMDCDGEDRPVDALTLLQQSAANPGKIIFAGRQSRKEGAGFQFFYQLYRLAFRMLTGRNIAFGNFVVLPAAVVSKLIYYSEIWNHVAGAILKTGLPYISVNTHRGRRYSGQSKMNFTKLLLHGLGAISVFVEVIATRLLIFSLSLIAISFIGILVLFYIRIFTDRAVPGWTSTVASAMLIILLQSFLLSLFTIFLYLSAQSQRKFIPALHFTDYTADLETLR